MRRYFTLWALPLVMTACQASGSSPALSPTVNGNVVPAPHRVAGAALRNATFSKPNVPDLEGPPRNAWIFASNSFSANVDVYSVKTLKMISSCPCSGIGLAVDPTTGDLAVSQRSGGVVSVWHVSGKGITQFATLHLSQGLYAVGLAYDNKGDLYAGNVGQAVIDLFPASEIAAGGGAPAQSVATSNLSDILYLAAPGDKLLADGYDMNGLPIVVSVNLKSGGDTVLQHLEQYGTVAEGIAVDIHGHLIVNSAGSSNTLLVFDKPWTGSPASSFPYGNGGNAYYTAISLNKKQDTLWAGNYVLSNPSHASTNVQANSYPLGSLGSASALIPNEFYDSIAVDPQAK